MIEQLEERQRLAWHSVDVANEKGGDFEELADAYERCANKLDDILGDALNEIKALEESSRFGEQCYQDRCENAYTPQTVVKRMQHEIDRLHEHLDDIARCCTHSEDADATVNSIVDGIVAVKQELEALRNGNRGDA